MFSLSLRMLSSVKDNSGDVSDQNLISSIWLYICTGPERGHFVSSLPYQERAPLSNLIKAFKSHDTRLPVPQYSILIQSFTNYWRSEQV